MQSEQILRYMRKNGSITAMEALRLCGCFRLSARIYDLRHQGFTIVTEQVRANNANIARYWLKENDNEDQL